VPKDDDLEAIKKAVDEAASVAAACCLEAKHVGPDRNNATRTTNQRE
jgi:hypothetical protein